MLKSGCNADAIYDWLLKDGLTIIKADVSYGWMLKNGCNADNYYLWLTVNQWFRADVSYDWLLKNGLELGRHVV